MPWYRVEDCNRENIERLGGRLHQKVNGRFVTILLHNEQLFCIDSCCYHASGPVGEGPVTDIEDIPTIRCMWHNMLFALDTGERISQETRLWDARAQRTESMRSKEEAADYRYFPEPDLVPFVIERATVERLKAALPELPAQRRRRYQQAYQLSAYDAGVLTQDQALGELFEGALAAGSAAKPAANWIMGDLLAYLNAKGLEPADAKLRPEWLAHLVELMARGTLSGRMAKDVFAQMLERGVDPAELVREGGLRQIVDPAALERIAEEVVQANRKSVDDYLGGKPTAFTFLMGQAMKRSQGKANPQQMGEMLKRALQKATSKREAA